jgi:hypothetical protein
VVSEPAGRRTRHPQFSRGEGVKDARGRRISIMSQVQ